MHPVASQSKEAKRRRRDFMAGLEARLGARRLFDVGPLREAFPKRPGSVDPKPLVPRRQP